MPAMFTISKYDQGTVNAGATQKRLKAHDFLVMLTSGVFARAVALGLGDHGKEAVQTITQLCYAWKLLVQPVIKPEVTLPLATMHERMHFSLVHCLLANFSRSHRLLAKMLPVRLLLSISVHVVNYRGGFIMSVTMLEDV
jgi:hypothetical protein